jgi:ATP-dependent DNA ligase
MKQYDGIQYWVFDVFYPSTNLSFETRLGYLKEFFNSTNISDQTNYMIVQTPTHKVKSEADQEKLYKSYLKKKYEGIILRNASSLYLSHPTKNSTAIRSKFVLKRKMTFDDEFEVVNFTQGVKGKDKGAIIWILKTHTTNKTFNATPKNTTYPERYKLYTEAKDNFDNKYKNRLMTVEYEDLSKDKIPLRAKSVGFRDHV